METFCDSVTKDVSQRADRSVTRDIFVGGWESDPEIDEFELRPAKLDKVVFERGLVGIESP